MKFEYDREMGLPEFRELCKAIHKEDREAYDTATSELLAIGYLPKVREDGMLTLCFEGPVPERERKEHQEYLANVYGQLTEDRDEKDDSNSEDDEEEGPGGGFIVGMLLVFLAMAGGYVIGKRSKRY